MAIGNIISDAQLTKDQLGPSDTTTLVFKKFDEVITILPTFYQFNKTNIGDAFTVGHAKNGIIGTANGEGGGQITIGVGDIGATSIARIFNDKDIFAEPLTTTTHIDTSNSTATVDTTNKLIQF